MAPFHVHSQLWQSSLSHAASLILTLLPPLRHLTTLMAAFCHPKAPYLKVNCSRLAILILSAALILFWHVYQRSRTGRRHILRYLLQGVGLCDCGGRLGESKIHRAGCQEGQLELRHMPKLLFTGGTSLSSRKPQLYFKILQLIEWCHPNYPE